MSHKNYLFKTNSYSLLLLLSIILLGCFFRFANLSAKVFWVDEVATAVRVSGYTIPEVTNNLAALDIVDKNTLISFQTINSNRTLQNSLDALIQSPEHAPLYFLLTRFWMQLWGNSIATIRSIAVMFSLFALLSLYWLCQELFGRAKVSWLAVGIMSLSPFYVAYAQEARPYSLWTTAILLAGASLLRAKRLNTISAWCWYGWWTIISLYTSLFSLYLITFQGLYLLAQINKNNLIIFKNYFIATACSLLAFSPWIYVIISHLDLLQDNTSWMRGNFNLADIIAVYIGTNLLVFGDLPLSTDSNPIQVAIALLSIVIISLISIKLYSRWQGRAIKFLGIALLSSLLFILTRYIYLDWTTIIGALVAIAILSLSVYSFYYLIVRTNKEGWLYILCLMLSLPLPLLITDIINQGQSSTAPRYLIPLQLGILIAVAVAITNWLNSDRRKLGQSIIAFFIIISIYSNVRNLNTSPFYQKGRNINNPAIAEIVNQDRTSLVVVEASAAMDAVSLAYSLAPEVKYKVIERQIDFDSYLNRFKHVFILKPSLELIGNLKLEPSLELKQMYKSHVFSADEFPLNLWQIKNNS